ncbi:DNA repair protein RadC [mine drainage metagenome]|uniref:DNA repair protein RadC n=1 Tax=mine drainage metagenome TaxID=410659 RepID=T0Y0Q4_9ZZZZ
MSKKQQGIKSEEPAVYHQEHGQDQEDALIASAEVILRKRFWRLGVVHQPSDAAEWLRMRLATRLAEVFCVLFLDTSHSIIAFEEMFQGTIDGARVEAREVVRACIKHNASAVVFAHQHPSGNCKPSAADIQITRDLKKALDLIGTHVLDHLVIGGMDTTSMMTQGLM